TLRATTVGVGEALVLHDRFDSKILISSGPPSMKASALSRYTCSVRVVGLAFSFFPRRIFLSCISTKARFVNLAMETGSTNHLLGHRTSDHDSFFRRRDRSRQQGAQSA